MISVLFSFCKTEFVCNIPETLGINQKYNMYGKPEAVFILANPPICKFLGGGRKPEKAKES